MLTSNPHKAEQLYSEHKDLVRDKLLKETVGHTLAKSLIEVEFDKVNGNTPRKSEEFLREGVVENRQEQSFAGQRLDAQADKAAAFVDSNLDTLTTQAAQEAEAAGTQIVLEHPVESRQ